MDGKDAVTPREFLASLNEDGAGHAPPLRGMVKPAEGDADSLMFVPGTSCRTWTKVPLSLIDSVTFLKNVPCRDHTHPLVSLRLKEPKTDEGRVFLALLQAAASVQRPRQGGRMVRGPQAGKAARNDGGTHGGWCETIPKYDVDVDGNIWCLDYCWESEQIAVFNPC